LISQIILYIGRAPFVYEKKVLPIFKEANIAIKLIRTECANHAQDFILNEDLSDYDGLVCVGGDGMFAELCHGLLLRTSYQTELNIDDPQVNLIRPNLKIGIIPAGSTDAVVFGTTGLSDPVTSALQIIVGETLSIDIATVNKSIFIFIYFCYF
jgi:ceramide kinase